MTNLLKTMKGIYSLYTMLLIVGCGLFNIAVHQRNEKKSDFQKETKIGKTAGMIYVVGGVIVFFVLKLIT